MDWAEYLKNSKEYKLVKDDTGKPAIYAHDHVWPYMSPLSLELTAYRHNWQDNALEHMRRAHNFIWPQYEATWNRWTERRFGAHCELLYQKKTITLAAGANAGKSLDAAKIALLFWLANPSGRTILVASTSLSDLDSRIWGYVKRFHDSDELAKVPLPGTLYTSPPPKLLFKKKDTVHGMFAVPLQRGTPSKTASTLIGRHPDDGFLAIIDEGTDVNPGFMEAVPNWEKAPIFQMIVIGNSASRFDPHGLLSRPIDGWDSVNPDFDREWETKTGICIYNDCYDSPAIDEPDPVKKKLLSNFLFTEQNIEQAKLDYGENSPKFQRFTRGFWPSEDQLQTVLTAVMIDKFNAQKEVKWSGKDQLYMLAGLDPAFNPDGDECILRFATYGIAANGLWTLDFGGEDNIHKLFIDAKAAEPAEFQILNQTRNLCHDYGVLPENLAIDVWGIGSGLGAIFTHNWSDYVYKVSSAGPPTKLWINAEQTETARDAYDRRVTELWFSMRQFVQGNQIRGLDDISCEQFSTRQFEWAGKKYCLETKQDYKLRMGKVDNRYKSPDRADAASMILDLARKFYRFIPGEFDADPDSENRPMAKFFRQEERERSMTRAEPVSRNPNPTNWNDGFRHSQFDVKENG